MSRSITPATLVPGLLIAAVLIVHRDLSLGMVLDWWHNDTLNQGLLIVPACICLFFTNKQPVDRADTWWPGLVLFLLAGIVILLGQQTHTRAVAEIGLLSSLLLVPVCLYGWQFLRRYWFVFAFALFAFPIWSLITPYAQLLTTRATVALLGLSSLPIYADGFSIQIPAGSFIVEEGCSGMRYLVSALAIGSLYVYLSAGKWTTRLWMFALLTGLALVGNWLRILTVIGIANFWGINHPMVGDHATLGWVIFAVLLLGWFWLGNRVLQPASPASDQRIPLTSLITPRQLIAGGAVLLGITIALPAATSQLLAPPQYRPIESANLLPPTWQSAAKNDWLHPHFPGGEQFVYQQVDSKTIAYLVFYQHQTDGAELINETNSTFDPERWELLERSRSVVSLKNETITVNEQIIKNRTGQRRLIWSWYEFGTRRTASPFVGKVYGLYSRIKNHNASAVVIFSSKVTDSTTESRHQLTQDIESSMEKLHAGMMALIASG